MVQRNFPRGRKFKNIRTGKNITLIGIGSKSAITKKFKIISSKNLRRR